MSSYRSDSIVAKQWLTIHFENAGKSSDDITLPVFTTTLSALEEVVHQTFVALECAPEVPPSSKAMLRQQFEQRFRLTCEPSSNGHNGIAVLLQPKDIADSESASTIRSLDSEIHRFKRYFDDVVVAACGAQEGKFVDLFVNEHTARRVAATLESMLPSHDFDLVLSSSSHAVEPILDSKRHRPALHDLVMRLDPRNSNGKTDHLSVVAEIEALDKANGTYRARTEDGLVVDGDINQTLSDAKVHFSPRIVERNGKFNVGEHHEIRSIKEIHGSARIDTSPIEISLLNVNDERLRANPPLQFTVKFHRTGHFYTLEGDFDVRFHAYSREDFEEILQEMFEDCWLEYALEYDSALTPDAQALKRELLDRLERV